MNKNFTALAAMAMVVALAATLIGCFLRAPAEAFAQSPSVDGQKLIYLTFDDGPSDAVTPKILDVLRDEKVKATFFIVGERAEGRTDILKRAFAEGHTLAIHSFSHRYDKIYSSKDALLKDIEQCNEVIRRITGAYSSLYRFPGGSNWVPDYLVKAVVERGYDYVDWNASFRDSEIVNPTPEQLYKAAIATVSHPDKIVMLAHDTTDKKTTVSALKKVIRHFKKEGYKFRAFM